MKICKLFESLRSLEISEFILLLFTLVSIPIWWRLSIIMLILLIVNAIIKVIAYREIGNNYSKWGEWSLLLIVILFGLYLISVCYSSNMKVAWNSMSMRLPLLLIPLFFLSSRLFYLTQQHIQILKYGFILSCFGVFVFCCIKTIILGITTDNSLSKLFWWTPYLHHHTYDSMYYLLALVLIYEEIINNWKGWTTFKKISSIIISCGVISVILFIQSRIGILAFIILIFIGVMLLIFKSKMVKLGIFVCTVGLGSLLIVNYTFKDKYKQLKQTLVEVVEQDKSDIRYEIWGNAIDVIQENPILGVGVGDRLIKLDANHLEKTGTNDKWDEVNPHNQFLDTWVAIGIPGVVCLLMIFLLPCINIIRHKPWNWEIISFLFIVGATALVESILERQMGLIFFTMIYGLLLYEHDKFFNQEVSLTK